MKKIILFIIYTAFTFAGWCNENKMTHSFKYHYGFILPHHKSIKYLTTENISAFEYNIDISTKGLFGWSEYFNHPKIGVGVYHTSLGNKEIFGKATAIFPFISFPLLQKKRWNFDTQLGIGPCYVSKYFTATKNYQNIAISSKYNAFFKLQGNFDYKLSSKFMITGGTGFMHISNGTTTQPNKGLNTWTSNLGIRYQLSSRFKCKSYKELSKYKKSISVTLNCGYKQASITDEHKYFINSISSVYEIYVFASQKLGFGVDLFYDRSTNRGNWNLKPETDFFDQFFQGLFFSYTLNFNRIDLYTNVGAYTYYKTDPEAALYTRVGLKYFFSDKFLCNLSLKAHGAKADFIEWGIGYKFNLK